MNVDKYILFQVLISNKELWVVHLIKIFRINNKSLKKFKQDLSLKLRNNKLDLNLETAIKDPEIYIKEVIEPFI